MPEEIKVENKEERQEDKLGFWKKLILIISIVAILVIVFLKVSNPDFKWLTFGLIALGVIVFLSLFFILMSQRKRIEDLLHTKEPKDKLPDAWEIDKVRDVIKEKVEDPTMYQNHISAWGDYDCETVGNNLIYHFVIYFEYFDDQSGLGEGANVIVNAHYPQDRICFLPFNASNKEIVMRTNKMSTNPQDVSEIREESEFMNPMTGVIEKHRKITPHHQEIKKLPEKKEGLE